jgi:hypothetical protein
MRMPQFTIRRLMVLVMIAGLALGAESMRRRSHAYRARAAQCGQWVAVNKAMIGSIALGGTNPGVSAQETRRRIEAEEKSARRRAEHYQRLESKYERAARYPWLPVEPDPPMPE